MLSAEAGSDRLCLSKLLVLRTGVSAVTSSMTSEIQMTFYQVSVEYDFMCLEFLIFVIRNEFTFLKMSIQKSDLLEWSLVRAGTVWEKLRKRYFAVLVCSAVNKVEPQFQWQWIVRSITRARRVPEVEVINGVSMFLSLRWILFARLAAVDLMLVLFGFQFSFCQPLWREQKHSWY